MSPVAPIRRRSRSRAWALVAGALLGAVLVALGGCRRPDPVLERLPAPMSTLDTVRAEQRTRSLDEAEYAAVEAAHDRYLETFATLRTTQIAPFLAEVLSRPREEWSQDERAVRSLASRQRAILAAIKALDESYLDELAGLLGAGRADFLEALALRRALDRANAVLIGDGDRVLLDLRAIVDGLRLEAEQRALVEGEILRFERESIPLAERIVRAQIDLPIEHLQVLARRGPPEADVDPSVTDAKRREQLVNEATQERYAEARRDLEVELLRHADLVDEAVARMMAALDEPSSLLLERRILRSRVADENGRAAENAAFEALIASRLRDVPAATKERIRIVRQRFLEADREAMRSWLVSLRASRVPGELHAGGPEASRERATDRRRIEGERARTIARFREELASLLPADRAARINALRGSNRVRFPEELAELIGANAAQALLPLKPRGFADEDPPAEAEEADRDGDREIQRIFLAPPPSDRDLARLADRAELDAATRDALALAVLSWRDRWNAVRDEGASRCEQESERMMRTFRGGDPDDSDRAVGRLLDVLAGFRERRSDLDRQLVEDFTAIVAPSDGAGAAQWQAAVTLWRFERGELRWRLRWNDMPWNDRLRVPREAQASLLDALVAAKLSGESSAAATAVLARRFDALAAEGESLRESGIDAVRGLLRIGTEARRQGQGEDEALGDGSPQAVRTLSAVRAAGIRFGTLQSEVLAELALAVTPPEARRLREAFARQLHPRLFDARGDLDRAFEALAKDGELDDARRAELDRIAVRRAERRDRALDGILRFSMSQLGEPALEGDDAVTRHPAIAEAVFLRDEADWRAAREALGLLGSDDRGRRRPFEAIFVDAPAMIRTFD